MLHTIAVVCDHRTLARSGLPPGSPRAVSTAFRLRPLALNLLLYPTMPSAISCNSSDTLLRSAASKRSMKSIPSK